MQAETIPSTFDLDCLQSETARRHYYRIYINYDLQTYDSRNVLRWRFILDP